VQYTKVPLANAYLPPSHNIALPFINASSRGEGGKEKGEGERRGKGGGGGERGREFALEVEGDLPRIFQTV